MSGRKIHDDVLYAHFVTFSCYRRRNLLDHPLPRGIVIDALSEQLTRLDGRCLGFVIMPNHVHAIVWFPTVGRISELMKQWKRTSSYRLKRQLRDIPAYAARLDGDDPIWQPRYYDFNIYSEGKLWEKLNYMHSNPVRAGLVEKAEEWLNGSARFYLLGERERVPMGFEPAPATKGNANADEVDGRSGPTLAVDGPSHAFGTRTRSCGCPDVETLGRHSIANVLES